MHDDYIIRKGISRYIYIVFERLDDNNILIKNRVTLTRDRSQILSASPWHHRECSLKPNNEDTNTCVY